MTRLPVIFLAFLVISACSTGRPVTIATVDDIRDLPELVITAEANPKTAPVKNPYRYTKTRYWDLLDTELDITFDWSTSTAPCRASLIMTPLRYTQETISLDAVGFLIGSVNLVGEQDSLVYEYDGQILDISLPELYTIEDTLQLEITYVARPEMNVEGGSSAIQSDKGLYFINPTGQFKDKPRQVWTQGETQSNSRWVPTFDQPNEQATHTIHITVDTMFETLSNGILQSSRVHDNGTKTDTWRMDLPHAPYLMMIAVGDYAITRDSWNGIPLEYYVEKPFAGDAEAIFPDAAPMLDFFSDYTGVPYPWAKLGQVVVRDYVSGAMENTTAIVYGEFVQLTARELIDRTRNEEICAHEIFHHWFGDLVTCESWSNTVLNEGFANFGEYLWLEHKYGLDEAEAHRRNELAGYLNQARRIQHPLVDYHYDHQDGMFDAHSYNKGGLVLHMLRDYLGEPAFQAGLNRYLVRNAYSTVEIHDLRLAMEFVSGEDLNWFFNQWYHQSGHPEIAWNWSYDSIGQQLSITIEQVQDIPENGSVYILPTEFAVLNSKDRILRFPLVIEEQKQVFTYHLKEKPLLVDLDPDRGLLMEQEAPDWSLHSAKAYWRTTPSVWSRLDILELLGKEGVNLKPYPWQDAFWQVRLTALENRTTVDTEFLPSLIKLVELDPRSEVRAQALALLNGEEIPDYPNFLLGLVYSDPAYPVVATALHLLMDVNRDMAMNALESLESDVSITSTLIISGLYARSEDVSRIPFFLSAWNRVNGFPRIQFMKNYIDLARYASQEDKKLAISRLTEEAHSNTWTTTRRYSAFRTLAVFRQHLLNSDPELAEVISSNLDRIKSLETDPGLLRYYNNY